MKKELTPRKWATVIIVGVILGVLLVYFGSQTWELVSWLFPQQSTWARLGALFSFDIMAFIWSILCIVYEFERKWVHYMSETMGLVSFVLATIASFLQMYMASTERLSFLLSTDAIKFAYVLVIVAITLQLITLGIGARVEIHALANSKPNVPMQRGVPPTRPVQGVPSPLAAPQAQNGN